MKILKINKKENIVSLIPHSLDDLWVLERIISPGDLIKAKSSRLIKSKDLEKKSERIPITVVLKAEKIVLEENKLRVIGLIDSGSPKELIQLKSHHSIDFSFGKKYSIKKPFSWKEFELEKLLKAEKESKKPRILLIAIDDEQADIALLHSFGFKELTSIKSRKSGKQFLTKKTESNYFNDLLKFIESQEPMMVLVAGPGFTKDDFKQFLKERKTTKKFFFDSISCTGITGFNEMLKRGLIEKLQKESLLVEENKLIEKLFNEIFKESNKVVYGLKEVRKAIEEKKAKEIFVSDKLFLSRRQEINELLIKSEELKTRIHLISSKHEAGKRLDGITGIAALLWF